MSQIRIFADDAPGKAIMTSTSGKHIAHELAAIGVTFERWFTNAQIEPGASSQAVIAAYQHDIERLKREGGYQAVDVVSLQPDHPDRAMLRQKFLNEHTHAEDEVRFFVAGSGLFTLHVNRKVCEIRCERGDLIRVPAGTKHWFDMGEHPHFVAIRLFTNPAGWVAQFTGDNIALNFPRYEPAK
jgi:1,2-dihydroxy-3-keto-5-methylthiopentene dioxygenase